MGELLEQSTLSRVFIRLSGIVQGVGFRPFVYRLAQHYALRGQVSNNGGEVHIEAQGKADAISQFQRALFEKAPAISRPHLVSILPQPLRHSACFEITPSGDGELRHVHLPPDYFTCDDCLAELSDPGNPRFDYPFINCTQCGPRYTIIHSLPYDRNNTSMSAFSLCPDCESEYRNPNDRRYHAEPLSCPECGPELYFSSPNENEFTNKASLRACVQAINQGEIVAIKGVGGYHLCCDALDVVAIQRLRDNKKRPHKPLAVMFPQVGDDGLRLMRQFVEISGTQRQLLRSPARPIVLVEKIAGKLPDIVAPGLSQIGVMLPYSPLHHLLMKRLKRPIIATSANISGEPVLTDSREVENRLSNITRHFLHHERAIVRPADDSVIKVIAEHARPIRVGRGVAPVELTLARKLKYPILACGGHLKNCIALAFDNRVVISPHIGEMGSLRAQQVFENLIEDFQRLYQVNVEQLVCDAHPHYLTSRWAKKQSKQVISVLHHHAHAACLPGEYPEHANWLVFTWDGVGYGGDGSMWGGETFYGTAGSWQRVASLRTFPLLGGDKVSREPWRSALALCWEMGISQWPGSDIDAHKIEILRAANNRGNAVQTSAVGRLFDAIAAMLNICQNVSYEGQAAMMLETIACNAQAPEISLPMESDENGVLRIDWAPLVEHIINEMRNRRLSQRMLVISAAYQLHASLARNILQQCILFRQRYGEFAIGLSGGVFQNKLLVELVVAKLRRAGFQVLMPTRIPVNDGGLSFGQIIEAAARMRLAS